MISLSCLSLPASDGRYTSYDCRSCSVGGRVGLRFQTSTIKTHTNLRPSSRLQVTRVWSRFRIFVPHFTHNNFPMTAPLLFATHQIEAIRVICACGRRASLSLPPLTKLRRNIIQAALAPFVRITPARKTRHTSRITASMCARVSDGTDSFRVCSALTSFCTGDVMSTCAAQNKRGREWATNESVVSFVCICSECMALVSPNAGKREGDESPHQSKNVRLDLSGKRRE